MVYMAEISLICRLRFRGAMRGMPPPTLASYRRLTLRSCARVRSSGPYLDRTSLLAVTTCLPCDKALIINSLAGFSPPISSMTISISGSSRMAFASMVKIAGSIKGDFFLLESRSATRLSTKGILA